MSNGAANGGSGGLLGTWAHRQTRFDRSEKTRAKPSQPARQPSLPAHIPGMPQEPERAPAAPALPNPASGKRSRAQANGVDGGEAAGQALTTAGVARESTEESGDGDEDDAAVRQAAWRWRFNRRWVQEQARQLDPEYGRQVRFAALCAVKAIKVERRCAGVTEVSGTVAAYWLALSI